MGLARHYGLKPKDVKPLAPAVKYEALATGSVDVIDGYSTDGLLAKYDLVVLEDDRHFFPPYEAAALVSPRLASERPDAIAALSLLSGRISVAEMRALNQALEVDRREVRNVAREALVAMALSPDSLTRAGSTDGVASDGFWSYFWARRAETWRLLLRHLLLVTVALGAAIVVAVPIGLVLERQPAASGATLGSLGVLQTIPGIALLAFMIPFLGVGLAPALVALWLYALYPIARNTFTGVRDADVDAIEALEALGATPEQRLMWVRVPLALPVILAGVRTAAVITVGAATLAAFVGAGGLGDPIVAGLALADMRLVMSGAIPAAAMALVVDGVLALVERALRPAHLKV